jgi:Na+/H+ antiporter NhaA
VLASRQNHNQILEVRDYAENASTPLRRWEDALHIPVALFILPLFSLTNTDKKEGWVHTITSELICNYFYT